ncbi:MAG TPA: DJ-1 family glyoxalase III [Candidatus Eisenbacteria bacterium]|nr:DJ-1 family glyoxalase III [Candidatus Eisenbacteria bacterium]
MPRVLVPLAQGCEELEAVTVIDILRRAGVEVVTVGLTPGPVRASRGVVILPDSILDAVLAESFDMIVLPGGKEGAERLGADTRIRDLLRRMAAEGRYVAAICAAPAVLAKAGLLDGRRATAFPGILDRVTELTSSAEAVVRDGTIVTSRGPGTALDFALELVRLLQGDAVKAAVEAPLQRS